jgi:DNA repair photolyase
VLEAFRGFKGLTISITTKSALVARDVGLLVELAKRHDVSVNISIISADPVLVRRSSRRRRFPMPGFARSARWYRPASRPAS